MNKPQTNPKMPLESFSQDALIDLLARLFQAENMVQVAFIFDCASDKLIKTLQKRLDGMEG